MQEGRRGAEMKKILKMLFNRVVLVGLAILVQVLLLILMVVKFQE